MINDADKLESPPQPLSGVGFFETYLRNGGEIPSWEGQYL